MAIYLTVLVALWAGGMLAVVSMAEHSGGGQNGLRRMAAGSNSADRGF